MNHSTSQLSLAQARAEHAPGAILSSGIGDPGQNMALDEALLDAMPRLQIPVLRFYGWTQPAASFGYFQKYAHVEQMTPLRPLVRRPTGGGIVPHEADWTYSLVFPAGHEWYSLPAVGSYRRVHEWLQTAFTSLGVETTLAPEPLKAQPGQCFVGCERYDLLCRGRKLAGAAQRRRKDGLLIQGSVQPGGLGMTRGDWEQSMGVAAERREGGRWLRCAPDSELLERAAFLRERKYGQAGYNQGR